jgi:transposase
MTASYLPYDPQQMFLLPPALQEWLPDGHLAHFIGDTVDVLDLSAFHARYAKGGPRNQPFHPAMMVKVLLYGYATGVFSSRKIARKLHEDVAFRVLAAGNFPAHRTIRDFRALHLKELAELFVQVVRLAREMGLVRLGTIAVDGTKVKANASRHKAMSYERMLQSERELRSQIEALLARARVADEAEKLRQQFQTGSAELDARFAAEAKALDEAFAVEAREAALGADPQRAVEAVLEQRLHARLREAFAAAEQAERARGLGGRRERDREQQRDHDQDREQRRLGVAPGGALRSGSRVTHVVAGPQRRAAY